MSSSLPTVLSSAVVREGMNASNAAATVVTGADALCEGLLSLCMLLLWHTILSSDSRALSRISFLRKETCADVGIAIQINEWTAYVSEDTAF